MDAGKIKDTMKTHPAPLKVLMLGNSFSICVGKMLPAIANASGTHALELTSACIGGCPLRLHWENIMRSENDPDARQYAVKVWRSRDLSEEDLPEDSINNLIKKADWDIITIQQASHESWDYQNYQPFAASLAAYIKKHAPKSEIVIQQTWAYNENDARIDPQNGQEWGFDQAGMYERAAAAYRRLAAETGFRVIPSGLAVQNVRALGPLPVPQPEGGAPLTGRAADVVGADGDNIHLNARGEFLQACVWYSFLFGEPADGITFTPENIDANYGQTLKDCAQAAVKGWN